jgi:hypothetical protein
MIIQLASRSNTTASNVLICKIILLYFVLIFIKILYMIIKRNLFILLIIFSCSRNNVLTSQINNIDTTSYLLNSPTPLEIQTYDGSGQLTHPDIIFFSNSFNGYNFWLAFTPYPYNNSAFENPSVIVSSDSRNWIIPTNLINPVVGKPQTGHNADPDIIYNKNTDELWLYFTQSVSNNNSELASLSYTKSKNGVNWSQPMAVFDYTRWTVVSPTVVSLDSVFIMWTVNSGKDGWVSQMNTLERRTSSNGIDWSEPQVCSLYQPNYIIWHIDVIYVNRYKEYWMLFGAYPKGEKSDASILFFAKSKDGHFWRTFERPLINKGKGWDKKSIYRATSLYNENTDTLKIYYSAINRWNAWKVGSIEVDYSELNNILKSIKTDVGDNDSGMLLETYSLFQNYWIH